MLLLQTTAIGHFYGIRELLKDVELEIHRGDRIGLVGKNGEGKSTLMRILADVEQPENGMVTWLSSIAYVPQSLEVEGDQLVSDWIAAQGMSVQSQYARELGLRDHIWDLPIGSLSGGEQTKVALLAALSQKPELLLLDEPTNHLDMDTVRWLEKWLKNSKTALLVISHDRRFLDEVTNITWELKNCGVTAYPGSYQKYAEWAAGERDRIQHEYDEYQKEKKRLEEAIRQKEIWAAKGERGGKVTDPSWKLRKAGERKSASKMHDKSKAMQKRLDNLEPEEKPETQMVADVKFLAIETAERSVLLRGEKLTFQYGERAILDGVDFEVGKHDRIALVGPNGMGKSTLLNLISGALTPESGHLRLTPTATLGYFDQVFETLDLDKTLLDDILELPNMDKTTARLFLGSFLFKQDDVFRKLSSLSYGERVRFVFVKLILARNNMLVLDEPSNHLDISTREKIEEALGDYPGAFICASHDRYFLEKMTNKVWEIRDGKLTVHPYGFKEYLERQNEQAQTPKSVSKKERVRQIKEEILVIETRLANLSWELSAVTDAEQKQQMDQEFIQLSRHANQLRREIS